MALAYLGEFDLGVLTPVSVSCAASLTARLGLDLGLLVDLQAGITLTWPGISANITALVALIAEIQAGITLGLTLPSVNFMADAIASLTADLVVPLAFSLGLGGGAGIFLYGYQGPGSTFGTAVQSELTSTWRDGTSTNAHANAVVLATVNPVTWNQVLGFFGAVPPGLPPGLTYVGQYNIGTMCPITVTATAGIIAELNARLAGMLALSITPPSISLTVLLNGALALRAALQAALTVQLPGVGFQLAATAQLIAKLDAQIALLAQFSAILAGAGVMVFEHDGPANQLGPSLTSALSSAWPDGSTLGVNANALVLGVVSPAVWLVVRAFFGAL
jgi:hypothetical protein